MFSETASHQNRFGVVIIVYITLFLDNVLLTVIVPILPDYLARISNNNNITYSLPQSIAYKNFDLHYVPAILTKHPIPGKSLVNFTAAGNQQQSQQEQQQQQQELQDKFQNITNNNNENESILQGENGSIGILLAVKALVQLICNPIVGGMTTKFGYRLPMFCGTLCLLISSLVFAAGETYVTLLIARALQGIGSACIGVCGMSLVAQLYPEDDKRSKIMGIVLGSIALGVLLGYPVGGILYDFVGKSAPFYILSIIIFINLVTQYLCMDLSVKPEIIIESDKPKWKPLLQDKMIIAIVIGIWLSTSTMAILEPCLPIWLLEHLQPKKWQLGTVFIPDSVGYFVGTNFFGTMAYNFGQIKISCVALLLVGLSCILIPSATTVYGLLLPHFGLGLGIGVVDAALVPLLASLVDANLSDDDSTTSDSMSNYGTVYAIQQTSVSLAYCLAPLIGGELAETIGFPWLMRSVGTLNFIYGPTLLLYYSHHKLNVGFPKSNQILLTSTADDSTNYKRLYHSVE